MLSETTFNRLYCEESPKMKQWLRANGMDAPTAEDLVQECFLRVWRRRETVEDAMASSALLWAALRNLRIDYFRRQRPMLSLDIPEHTELLEPVFDAPLTEMDCAYFRQRLNEALQTLPVKIRETFHLFFIEECPIKEIALRTNASESLVKVRIYRARQRLQPLLRDL